MELKRITKNEFAKYYDLLEKDFIFDFNISTII